MKKEYIEVLLSSSAEIIEFKNTFSDLGYADEEVIGENWFKVFIKSEEYIEIFKVFSELFQHNHKKWKTYGNDIICKDGSLKCIDFSNEIIDLNGELFMKFIGVEKHS